MWTRVGYGRCEGGDAGGRVVQGDRAGLEGDVVVDEGKNVMEEFADRLLNNERDYSDRRNIRQMGEDDGRHLWKVR